MANRRKSWPLYEIKWIDASSKHEEHELTDLPPLKAIKTVGFLMKESESTVWLAQEILDVDGDLTLRCTTSIPVKWIEERTLLKKVASDKAGA